MHTGAFCECIVDLKACVSLLGGFVFASLSAYVLSPGKKGSKLSLFYCLKHVDSLQCE